MSVLADLPELASGPSVATAAGLLVAGAIASAVRRRPLAEVCVAWALGFLVLHLLVGLLGGSVATGFALSCALVAVLVVLAPWLLGRAGPPLPGARPGRPEAEPTVASPGIRVQQRAVRFREAEARDEIAERLARPEPITHLWSADGYRDVTRGSAP